MFFQQVDHYQQFHNIFPAVQTCAEWWGIYPYMAMFLWAVYVLSPMWIHCWIQKGNIDVWDMKYDAIFYRIDKISECHDLNYMNCYIEDNGTCSHSVEIIKYMYMKWTNKSILKCVLTTVWYDPTLIMPFPFSFPFSVQCWFSLSGIGSITHYQYRTPGLMSSQWDTVSSNCIITLSACMGNK